MWLFPSRCPGCGRVGPAPCDRCIARMVRGADPPPPPGLDWCRCLLVYEEPARSVVSHIKYRNARSSLAWLATAMAPLLDGHDVDCLTWAPTTPRRRQRRGFDHAELLARCLGAEVGCAVAARLERREGPPQTGRCYEDRLEGPRFVAGGVNAGERIVVVDDVVTTGATVSRAASALRAAGVATVGAVAAAHPR